MSINDLIDATVRCLICDAKMGACDCWRPCPVCKIMYRTGSACRYAEEPEHLSIEGAMIGCICEKPHAARRVCADARERKLKTPCRCACHAKKFRHLESVAQ